MIDLCALIFAWAKYQRTKGAVKLHLLLDHDGYLPSVAVITEGKVADVRVARELRFEPGTILVIDRGYVDFTWFERLTAQDVFFVTRPHATVTQSCSGSLSSLIHRGLIRVRLHRDTRTSVLTIARG